MNVPVNFTSLGAAVTDAIEGTIEQYCGNERTPGNSRIMDSASSAVGACMKALTQLGLNSAGINKCIAQGSESVRSCIRLCESPIEQIMLHALVFADWSPFLTIPAQTHTIDQPFPAGDVVVVPQFRIGGFRLDFLIICKAADGRQRWACIECDGKQFHHQNIVQHQRDQWRDSWLDALGIQTHRFKGDAIWTDCQGCVEEVIAEMTSWKKGVENAGG